MRPAKERLFAKRYRVLKNLGQGGMGDVYEAHDILTNRTVALKQIFRRQSSFDQDGVPSADVFQLTLLSGKSVEVLEPNLRFKMEFRSMTKLKHPNTIEVLDFGALENGDHYIAMELVPGEGLDKILKTRPLAYPEIYRILTQLCQVLNFIHSRHMVHRDLKPSNIWITPEGLVKLMDFGVMQQMGLPSNGKLVGTVGYMPPETISGGIIDATSDLYSLGILAYELVAGHPPFQGTDLMELIKKHLQEPPRPLKQIKPDVPEKLERLIKKLLEKSQFKRYKDVPELWDDLTSLSGEKVALENLEQKRSYLNCSQMIGREKDFAHLKEALQALQKKQSRSIFLAGSSGMGKSRMVQEFRLLAQLAGVSFYYGQCTEQGMSAYQPFVQAFQPLLQQTDKMTLDHLGPLLVKILSQLSDKGYQPLATLDPASEKLRLYEAVTHWLKAVSQKAGFVLCLEDLQWADPATLELLTNLIRECGGNPIFFLGNYRNDELENSQLLLQSEEEGFTQVLTLSPLEERHVQAMIIGMLGKSELPEEFAREVFKATAGNPYFISELMRNLIEDETLKLINGRWHLPLDIASVNLPNSIQSTVSRRLKRLSREAFHLAQTASVMGSSFDLVFLKDHSSYTEEQLWELLDELVVKQFITSSETSYSFVHDRTRETLTQQLGDREKRKLHEEVGCYLEKAHAQNLEDVAAELAHHFGRGFNQHKAARYCLMAGLRSYKQSALVECTGLLKEGIETLELLEDYPDKRWWLLEAREKLYMAALFYDGPLCAKTCEKLLKDLHRLAGGQTVIHLVVRFFRAVFWLINLLPKSLSAKAKKVLNRPPRPYPLGQGQMAKFLARSDLASILARIITCQSYYIVVCPWAGDFQKSIELSRRNQQYFPDPTGVFRAASLASLSVVYLYQGRMESFKKTAEEAMRIFQENKDQLNRDLWYLFAMATAISTFRNCWGGRKALEESTIEICQSMVAEYNMLDIEFWLYHFKTIWHIFHGRHGEYLKTVEKEAQISRKLGKPSFMETWRLAAITLDAIPRGDFGMAQQAIKRWDELIQTQKDYWNQSYAEECKGRLAMEEGDLEEALKHFQRGVELTRENLLEPLPTNLYRSAEVLLEMGRLDESQACLEEARSIVEDPEINNPYRQTYVYRLLGLLELKKKNYPEAEKCLTKALALCEECGNEFEQAVTHVSLAQYYLDLKNTVFAEKEADLAEEKFLSLGNSYQVKKMKDLLSNLQEIL